MPNACAAERGCVQQHHPPPDPVREQQRQDGIRANHNIHGKGQPTFLQQQPAIHHSHIRVMSQSSVEPSVLYHNAPTPPCSPPPLRSHWTCTFRRATGQWWACTSQCLTGPSSVGYVVECTVSCPRWRPLSHVPAAVCRVGGKACSPHGILQPGCLPGEMCSRAHPASLPLNASDLRLWLGTRFQ